MAVFTSLAMPFPLALESKTQRVVLADVALDHVEGSDFLEKQNVVWDVRSRSLVDAVNGLLALLREEGPIPTAAQAKKENERQARERQARESEGLHPGDDGGGWTRAPRGGFMAPAVVAPQNILLILSEKNLDRVLEYLGGGKESVPAYKIVPGGVELNL